MTTTTEPTTPARIGRKPIGDRAVTHLPPAITKRIEEIAKDRAPEGKRPNTSKVLRELVIIGLAVEVSDAAKAKMMADAGLPA